MHPHTYIRFFLKKFVDSQGNKKLEQNLQAYVLNIF